MRAFFLSTASVVSLALMSQVAAAQNLPPIFKAGPAPGVTPAYGVTPPAPDATASPKAYAAWQQAMAVAHPSAGAPNIVSTTLSAGPAQAVVGAGTAVNSSNWSGTAIVNSNDPFRIEAVVSEFVVSPVQQAFGTCNGGWDYVVMWPGIDGYGSSDVLQGGSLQEAYCSGSTKSTYYSAWVEWYPYSLTTVSSPAISPGDLLFVEVWSTSRTQGYVYLVDETNQQSAEYSLTPPSGTELTGNSVEWIVERPGVGGGLATLANYISSAWNEGFAWNYKATTPTYWYEGQQGSSYFYDITMLDNSSNPISSAAIENKDFLWFTNYGSSY
ncbi:MAG: G1 family glutamic endopeptidase [Roseiarcus sp.]